MLNYVENPSAPPETSNECKVSDVQKAYAQAKPTDTILNIFVYERTKPHLKPHRRLATNIV
jgi:hypothetical protein